MSILAHLGELLGSSLGSFVYHLLLLLVVQAILGMALDEWQRSRREQARRLLAFAVGLTVARLFYLVPALLSLSGWPSLAAWLPPLERSVDAACILLLGWAFTRAPGRWARVWNLVFVANLALVVAGAVGLTMLWTGALGAGPVLVGTGLKPALIEGPTLAYDLSWHSTVWAVWQMALIVLAGLSVLLGRDEDKGTFLLAMLYLLCGRLLPFAYPASTPGLPVWDRLANLIAYPLVAVAVYQKIINRLRTNADQLQEISQASFDQIKSLLILFEATRQASASLDLPTVLDASVQGIARALEADQCAIALIEEAEPSYVRLAAIYSPTRPGPAGAGFKPARNAKDPHAGEPIRFPIEYQLAIQQAIRRKKPVLVEELDNVQLKALFAFLGSGETGPLLVQPLLQGGEAVGVAIVANPRSQRPFTPHQAKLCQSMAEQVSVNIQNARRYQAAQDRIKELHRLLDQERHCEGRRPEAIPEPPEAGRGSWPLSTPSELAGPIEQGGVAP